MAPMLIDRETTRLAPHDEFLRTSVSAVPTALLPSKDAQTQWSVHPIAERLKVLKRARHLLAARTQSLCEAIPSNLTRNHADTLAAEVLPLLDACKFLEREAESILQPQKLGRRGLPLWLSGIQSSIERVPMGTVLIIGPSNYPLLLAGVQVFQALAAGNAAIWKPGRGGRAVAMLCAEALHQAGFPEPLLQVTAESVEAAQSAIDAGVDKVFFTGSATSGAALLHQLAGTLTPCVAELSGCDAVFILPSANLSRVADALAFGTRLNGSATCMAPRRIVLIGADESRKQQFVDLLLAALHPVAKTLLPHETATLLFDLLEDAIAKGATLRGEFAPSGQGPLLVTNANASMRLPQADVFAPVLTLLDATSTHDAIALNQACPFALTASIFGDEQQALEMASSITAGTVIINDLIVPTIDPRLPFGGRRRSGFGVTRGREGLLEMTAVKVVAVRRGKTRHFEATTPAHLPLFDGMIQAAHAGTWAQRLAGLKQMAAAARSLAATTTIRKNK